MVCLTDVDALIKEAGKLWEEMPDGEELSKELMKAINHAPTVDAVPVKHGRWEELRHGNISNNSDVEWQSARCSVCGRYLTTPLMYYFAEYNYCPNCGAKMDGEAKGGDNNG